MVTDLLVAPPTGLLRFVCLCLAALIVDVLILIVGLGSSYRQSWMGRSSMPSNHGWSHAHCEVLAGM